MIIPLYHKLAIWYVDIGLHLPFFELKSDSKKIDIGMLGDSLAVLSFFALIVSLWLTGRALTKQSEELKLNRKEMQQNIEEAKQANKLRAEFEVLENLRSLGENYELENNEETQESKTNRLIVRFNLSRLIEHSLEILVKITREEENNNPYLVPDRKPLFQEYFLPMS